MTRTMAMATITAMGTTITTKLECPRVVPLAATIGWH